MLATNTLIYCYETLNWYDLSGGQFGNMYKRFQNVQTLFLEIDPLKIIRDVYIKTQVGAYCIVL